MFAGLDGLAPGYGVRIWGVVSGSRRSSMEVQGARHMHLSDDCVACSRMLMWFAGRWQLHHGGSQSVSRYQFLVLSGFAIDCHRG